MATTTYNYTVTPAMGWTQVATASAYLRVTAAPTQRPFYLYIGDTAPTQVQTSAGIYVDDGVFWSNIPFTGNVYVLVNDGTMRLDVEAIPNGAAATVTKAAPLGVGTDRSGTITTANTSQVLAPANANRSYLKGQNISTGVLYINEVGGAATTGAGSYQVPAGGSFSINTNQQVSILGATAGQAFTATEG